MCRKDKSLKFLINVERKRVKTLINFTYQQPTCNKYNNKQKM